MMTSFQVKQRARALGFDLCGIARAEPLDELARLPEWLARGFAGRMTYLNRGARVRSDIRRWLPSARSVVAVAAVYHTDQPHHIEMADPRRARIARYAWGDDYHETLGTRLDALAAWMRGAAGTGFEARWCVDHGPVQEKAWAARAGLGWIGRNTCLVNPDIGSWTVLGVLACNLELEPDTPALDQCGTCRQCLDVCPTGALIEPHVLDARRCLSYLTIEIRGAIPESQRRDLGAHVFGCDLCQDVCPYNASAPVAHDACWQPRQALRDATLAGLWARGDNDLAGAIEGTALRRAGVVGLRRNLAVALGNAGHRPAGPLEEDSSQLSGDRAGQPGGRPSLEHPVVAEHVAWARGIVSRAAPRLHRD
jgi:epoxyqueuosine reductase